MPYFTDTQIGAEPESIQDYDPSFGLSLGTAVEDAFISNPTKVIYDYTKVRSANQGERLDRTEAEQRVKESGTQIKIPAIGYTREALDMVIERKQDEMTRQSILDRAPAGILPSTTRFTASLLTSILDPINVASAFVPVVGQERYAAMVANASGAFGRAGARFAVGAAEGAVGAALIEPINLALRTQMQDDYSMVDSLINVGFGTAMGGGLHVGGGVIKDAYRPRIGELAKASAEDVHVAQMDDAIAPHTPTPDSVAAKVDAVAPETRAAGLRVAVAQAMEGRSVDVEPVLNADPRYIEATERAESNIKIIENEDNSYLRAKSEFGEVSGTIKEDGLYINFSQVSDEHQGKGHGKALYQAIIDDAHAKGLRVFSDNIVEGRAVKVYESLARDGYEVKKTEGVFDLGPDSQSPLGVLSGPNKEAGQAKGAPVFEVLQKEKVDVTDTDKAIGMARETARRATSPESISVADFAASRAADERLALAPQGDDAAEKALESTMARLDQTIKNLELRGMAPEKVAALRDALKPFDDDLKDAQKLGDAARAYVVCNL